MRRTTLPLPPTVEVQCDFCGRYGRYPRARYIEIAGTENAPDALSRFAAARGCARAIKAGPTDLDNRCRIKYVHRRREPSERGS